MSTEITSTAKDGTVTTVKTPTYTVSFGKKVGKPNYGNEEFSVFAQVEVDPGDDMGAIAEKLADQASFIKGVVFAQLGLMSATSPEGVVMAVEATVDTPKAAAAPARSGNYNAPRRGNGGGGAPRQGGGSASNALWEEWLERPENFYDNTEKKASGQYKPNAADYKHKESGTGMWLKDAPQFVKDAQSNEVY